MSNIKPFTIHGEPVRDLNWFVPVDQWQPIDQQDQIFKPCKGALWLPVTGFFGISDPSKENLNLFVLSTKRCYNGEIMRDHITRYLNYFEKFYDPEHELLGMICRIKTNIDLVPSYSKEQFRYDIERLILCDSICMKAVLMNNDNYDLTLDEKNYKNEKNPSLIYSDRHAKILLWMSLLMNMVIPLATHFIYVKKISNTNEFLLWVFDSIISLTDVDIYNKLYETSSSNVNRSAKKHERLWNRQDIRGKDTTTHSLESVQNIILNIMPKYSYSSNIISFNYTSINKNIYYQVTGIESKVHIYWKRCVSKLFELLGSAKALMLRFHLSKSRKTETSSEMVYGETKAYSSVGPKYCMAMYNQQPSPERI